MARVTTEDCAEAIPNRFELVVLAAYRAKAISEGDNILVERDNDRNPVVALREIAEQQTDRKVLRDRAVARCQRNRPSTEPEFDDAFSLEDRHIKSWIVPME